MKNIEKIINQSKYKHIFDMAKRAGKLGLKENVKVYIVGGVVRDLMLGRDIQDLDLMVEGDGIFFARKLAKEIGVKKMSKTTDARLFKPALSCDEEPSITAFTELALLSRDSLQ